MHGGVLPLFPHKGGTFRRKRKRGEGSLRKIRDNIASIIRGGRGGRSPAGKRKRTDATEVERKIVAETSGPFKGYHLDYFGIEGGGRYRVGGR